MSSHKTVLVTGGTGLLGNAVLAELLENDPSLHLVVLVRDPAKWLIHERALPGSAGRMTHLESDLCAEGLGLKSRERKLISREVSAIIHLAADTTFSRPLEEARAVNTEGTRRLLELAQECAPGIRMAYVSTAFVAGRRTGVISEDAGSGRAGWVNAYEQSKYEAELLVRASATDWVIMRPSTIICDDLSGRISQLNAVHRGLRLYREGLAAMMPGGEESRLDAITTEYASAAIARLAFGAESSRRTLHLCAGKGAIPLPEMLDLTFARWAADSAWRRRKIARPVLANLPTYALFEQTIEATADVSLKRVTRILSHFVPHLGLPKYFDTSVADRLLGFSAPPVAGYWAAMVERLTTVNWNVPSAAPCSP